MRATRKKHIRKYLNHFRMVFGIKEPYNVIVDGNFLHTCMACKVGFREGLASIFENAFPCVTSCIVNELKNMGEEFSNAALIARRLQHIPCRHDPSLTPAECILSVIGESNPGKRAVASQDKRLREKLAKTGNAPLVFLNAHNIVSLEAPSAFSKAKAEELNYQKVLGASATPKPDEPAAETKKKKKEKKPSTKRMKRLNPASIVIKKAPIADETVTITDEVTGDAIKKKRKRVHRKKAQKPTSTETSQAQQHSDNASDE
eukprot:TRINITY_DN6014_c0_g1_i1.p1 TRINITY_DN6014_c0_g1~~TRINITY_DN6014_c0_g1_i1.p1  ORF type:complete len:260 (+),score=71.56 TRINITY_DN6014_c0_g1_i1:70-849(+)